MSDADQESQESMEVDVDHLVGDVVSMVDDLITHSNRDTIIAGLNAEIDMVQARFTVLSALRDSLTGETEEEAELPLAEPEPRAVDAGGDIESLIVQHVSKHGPSMPGDIAAAIGVHATKIGRVVSKSNALAKDGKLITVKLS